MNISYNWLKRYIALQDDAETVANITLIMLHQTDYLLRKLIDKFKSDFLKNGGIREQMSSARREWRDTHR